MPTSTLEKKVDIDSGSGKLAASLADFSSSSTLGVLP
jgi:hypothetical protein